MSAGGAEGRNRPRVLKAKVSKRFSYACIKGARVRLGCGLRLKDSPSVEKALRFDAFYAWRKQQATFVLRELTSPSSTYAAYTSSTLDVREMLS